MTITYQLEEIDFEWDSAKAEINLQKHDVAFTEACEVFLDPFVYPIETREIDDEAREPFLASRANGDCCMSPTSGVS